MLQFTDMQVVGFIPHFLSEDDPRSAVEQIHENYAHGGGWRDFKGFKLVSDPFEGEGVLCSLNYPEDPPMMELSRAKLRDETLIFFQCSLLAVIQPNGSFRVARLD